MLEKQNELPNGYVLYAIAYCEYGSRDDVYFGSETQCSRNRFQQVLQRYDNSPTYLTSIVIHDVIGAMFNERFVDELFKPQDLYTNYAVREIFDKMAHSSIMKLNESSMDKVLLRDDS